MSKQSNRNRQQLKAAKRVADEARKKAEATEKSSGPPQRNDPSQSHGPVASHSDCEPKSLEFYIGAGLIWLFVNVALAILINHFSPFAWILYIPAGITCLAVAWLVRNVSKVRLWMIVLYVVILAVTHRYVQFELKASRNDGNLANLPGKIAEAEDQKYSGELLPASDPFPPLLRMDTNGIVLLLGKSMNMAHQFPHTVIMWRGIPALVLSTNSHGAAVSAKFFDDNGNIVADLENNRFNVNRLNSFMLERPDKSTLRVRDQHDVTVLDVRFMNPKLIKLTGLIRFPGGKEAFIDENSGFFSLENYNRDSRGADVFLW